MNTLRANVVDRKRGTSRTNQLSHAKVVAASLDKVVAADLDYSGLRGSQGPAHLENMPGTDSTVHEQQVLARRCALESNPAHQYMRPS